MKWDVVFCVVAQVVIGNMPPEITKCTLLVDRTGTSITDMQFVRQFASVFQNNYPERVYRIVVYPGGLVFTGLWNIVKWFLDPVTQQRLNLC